jgi:hypothetical protein
MYVTPELELTTDGEIAHLTCGERMITLMPGEGPRLLQSLKFSIGLGAKILEIRQGDMDGEVIELDRGQQLALCDVLTEIERVADADDERRAREL